MTQIEDRYNPGAIEAKIYQLWLDKKAFAAEDQSTKPPYSITLPPPNVTGALHIGHALDYTLQDVMIRFKRMSGYNAMWMPGMDHAGIATQSVVEKDLAKNEQVRRQDMGREKFVQRIWQWKEEHGGKILEQSKAMGFSMDWDRLRFTLDDKSNRAVEKVFVDLYKKGWIYKGQRLVNWSPKLESAISDLEVDNQERNGSLYHIQYPLEDSSERIEIATTRPETLLGDTAIAVHPNDARYTKLIGKLVKLPLSERSIPIIADEYVDKDFGSGALKITPAHDFNDYEVGKRHNLEMINILTKDAHLNDEVPEKYRGLHVQEARKKILEDLKQEGFLVKEEPHKMTTPICSRTGCVVEPYLSEQWFLKMQELAKPARHVVETKTIEFEPELWIKTYLHWLNNINDWCISRQLWWGHRIPVWYCKSCEHMQVSEEAPSKCESCGSQELKQDEDVLDTWFSSALWPFSTLGWPEKSEALKTFYPNSLLVTGHDILFFWVARMIMMGLEFQKDVPFKKVYFHGLVRDSQGRKMSKSLGNGIDPLEVVADQGADALRFCLLSQVQSGKDIRFSEQRLETARNFNNKIWNACRFALGAMQEMELIQDPAELKGKLSLADQWILFKLKNTIDRTNEHLEQCRFSDAASCLYAFTWHELCDWYIEFIKPKVYGEDSEAKKISQNILAYTFGRCLQLLHPLIPFITEELYSKIPGNDELLATSSYPTVSNQKSWLALAEEAKAKKLDTIKDVIVAIRNIRGENRIKPSAKLTAYLLPSNDKLQKTLSANKDLILRMSGLAECQVMEDTEKQKSAVNIVSVDQEQIEVVVPLEGFVDFEKELERVEKSIEKVNKNIQILEKKLSNENFVNNAPEEVVSADRQQLQQLKDEFQVLNEQKLRLS